jgi:hypothetical protein
MNVYKKLQIARLALQAKELKKSGKNKFAGYEYFELQDFLPTVQTIFADTDLCAVFRCDEAGATLTIYDTDKPEDSIMFTAPMAAAELKGCHPVQNLGASISYLRRYLYVNALEIVEHDALDATTGDSATKADPKPAPKVEPKPVPKAKPDKPAQSWEIQLTGDDDGDWFEVLHAGAKALLTFASSEADVMSIFKTNKVLFDDAKGRDPERFKALMEDFTKTKNKFKE